jgi:sugar/nucleoside kinase (ribokinase family)
VSKYDIYGIGAALVDTEIQVNDSDLSNFNIDKGVMTLVDSDRQTELLALLSGHLVHSKRASGGSAANSIIAASYFGAKTFYSCRVANDDNGKFYLNDLTDADVKFHNRAGSLEGDTGKCLVFITPDAERTMNTHLGISEFVSAEDLDEEAIAASRFAYIEGYLVTSETGRPAAIRLRELAEKSGVKTAISLSDPFIVNIFKDGLKEMIGNGVDLLFCNEDEALNFTCTENINDAAEALKSIAKSFAITLGAKGALIFNGDTLVTVAAEPVKALDTNGAGDMFAGAFMYGLCEGWSHEKSAKFACNAAGRVVSQYGPRLAAAQHAELLS